VPDAERCRKASREGTSKGVRSQRREISLCSPTWQEILSFSWDHCIGQPRMSVQTPPESEVTQDMHMNSRDTFLVTPKFIQSPVFTLFCLSPGNHHSRSLGGKYTFWEDCWVLAKEVRIGDLG